MPTQPTFSLTDNFLDLTNNKNFLQDEIDCCGLKVKRISGEFWTSKQRQACSIHEVSYRACFKPQLPNFFIKHFTSESDIVYDPFGGRGTTAIEAALLGRNIIQNDINPISTILSAGRLCAPQLQEISKRLDEIPLDKKIKSDIDLSMFYEENTLREILNLRLYFLKKIEKGTFDTIDNWIRMVATNRLTGHSPGFFSVYTLPPNQATTQKRQIKINETRNQTPEYRNTKAIILKKSKQLLGDVDDSTRKKLQDAFKRSLFINESASNTNAIESNSVSLVVTSPPFLDIVQYKDDNWLRCWFNNIDTNEVGKKITMSKSVSDWSNVMLEVLKELKRVLKKNGVIAFEVGEIRNGKIKLDEIIAPLGVKAGLTCDQIIINSQVFTKTSNIWGVDNNSSGTNSNRIVLFKK